MTRALVGVLVACASAAASAQPPVSVDVSRGVIADSIHAAIVRRLAEGFGGAIIVEKDGIAILKAGYGWANREHRVPFTTSTIAQVGSLTKQFTAAAIVDLALKGKISLSDSLALRIPDVPGASADITIQQLLTHTAGLPDGCATDFSRLSANELITRCLARVHLPAGREFSYSNEGYSVAAALLERVSGQSLEGYQSARFFSPLGMSRSGYFFSEMLHGSLASGYASAGVSAPISERLATLRPDFWNLKGNGGMQASAEDMYRWYGFLRRGRATGDSLALALTTPHARRDSTVSYGFGWFLRLGADGAVEQISHTGSDGVFFAAFVWRPRDKTFFYLVSNNGEKTGAELASAVLAHLRTTR
ncbi:MAG TPA: serine hydrolase domain-containing protein [Gemmatimonadaceae bacterium]|nr:serine hydrolase domain-containing protein [Gemmatimonadaceae bacterium]